MPRPEYWVEAEAKIDIDKGAEMDLASQLENYLDEAGRLKEWPSRRNRGQFQQRALEYLANKFTSDIYYSEKEVNALLNQHHTFGDPALLRRELVERKLLDRVKDGSAYWRCL